MHNKYDVLAAEGWQVLVGSGEDCKKFLQGHLTCDLTELTQDNPLLGAACDLKGRVVATMFLIARGGVKRKEINSNKQDEVLILLPEDSIDPLFELWNKYLMLYRKAQIKPREGGFELISVSADNNKPINEANPPPANINERIAGPVLAQSNVFIHLLDEAPSLKTDKSSSHDWNSYLIKKGIPYVRAASSGQMTPQMLNYDKLNAISWSKGCYLGQEVVARIHYKGKSARSCYRVSFDNKQGLQLHHNMPLHSIVNNKTSEIGKLINYCRANGSQYSGLALLNNNLVDMQNVFLLNPGSKANNIPIDVNRH